jgi:hypothetical protein
MGKSPMRARRPSSLSSVAYAAAIAGCVALGTWLFWPTLDAGLFADDYVALAMVDGRFSAPRRPLDLFDFANGSASDIAAAQRLGSIPWWAPDGFRIAFLRPLSSALWHVDRALFGDAVWAYHAHSIAAWALLVVAAGLCYRRVFTRGVAALSTLLFAIDHSQHFPVLWLSNRGGLYAIAFGVFGLCAHLRARAGGGGGARAYAWLSALCFTVGLGFGEWALPMLGYVLAYELVGATDAPRARLRALLGSLGPGAIFMLARALLGYGAHGSGAYVDPAVDPLRFAGALVTRVPVLLADMMWNVPAAWWDNGSPWRERVLGWDLVGPATWSRLPGWPAYHAALGALTVICVVALWRWTARGLHAAEARKLGFLSAGALLALLPVVGSFLSTRLTIGAFFGFAPLLALALRRVARVLLDAPRVPLPRWSAAYAAAALLVYLHVLEPLQQDIGLQADALSVTTPWVRNAEIDPERLGEQRVFLLASREFTTTFYFAYIWSYAGLPLPRSVYPLSAAPTAHDVVRVADDTIEMRALGGAFLQSSGEFMFRDRALYARTGEQRGLPGMRVEIARARRGAPEALRFVFERSVDDPSYVFLAATQTGFARVKMPAVGRTLRVPRASAPDWIKMQKERLHRRVGPPPDSFGFDPTPRFVAYRPERGPR